jgi:putative aldouronate transport system permease protein
VKTKIQPFDTFVYLILTVVIVLMSYPFLYLISVSLSAPDQVARVTFFPRGFNTAAYQYIFRAPAVLAGYFHTIVYTVTHVLIAVLLTLMCAYPLSKQWMAGRKIITVFIVITMFFSGGMIPLYLVLSNLKMLDKIWSIVLPTALSSWYMVIARTFFQGIPVELSESAYVDGAGEWRILRSIYLPLSKPIVATLVLFYTVGKWNSWFDAMLYLNDKAKYPIQLILRNMMATGLGSLDKGGAPSTIVNGVKLSDTSLNYALCVAVILPIILVYPFLQKYFIKGVMVGSLKG